MKMKLGLMSLIAGLCISAGAFAQDAKTDSPFYISLLWTVEHGRRLLFFWVKLIWWNADASLRF
jgi:hypothetical protein